jgi:hypothetical protein
MPGRLVFRPAALGSPCVSNDLGMACGTAGGSRTVSSLFMTATVRTAVATALLLAVVGPSANAQTFEGPGSRAQGMSAFVAVADDASAVYWNPAGLASGAYFSLVLDRTEGDALPSGADRGGKRSSWLLALSAPALGLSYYRLRSATFAPAGSGSPGFSRVQSLVTHHAGATLVQSIFDNLAVGATVKLVRGIATTAASPGNAEDRLDALDMGVASNHVDVDLGVMVTGRLVRAGLTVRNLAEPEFESLEDEVLRLSRQARAGVSLLLTERWTAAADLDLTRNRGPLGDVRTLAFGTEGRLTMRAVARAGVHVNLAGDRRAPVATLGGSYAVFGSMLVDAHFSTGSDEAFTGWGVAGRVVF